MASLRGLTGATPDHPDAYRDDVVQQRLLYGDLKWLAEQLETGNPTALVRFVRSLLLDDQVFVRPDDPATTLAALRQAGSLALGRFSDAVQSHW